MFPIYVEQRTKIADSLKTNIQSAQARATSDVNWATECHVKKQALLAKVTEDYVRLGYHVTDGWDAFGDFQKSSAYVRRLAQQMKRSYIEIKDSSRFTKHTRQSLTMPKLNKLAPLYAHFLIVAKDCNDTYPLAPNSLRIEKGSTIYTFTFTGNEKTPHPLYTDWIERAAHDPEWRTILKL